jgi:hypothetical protein
MSHRGRGGGLPMCHVTFFKDFFRRLGEILMTFFHYYYKNTLIFHFEKCHVTPGGGSGKMSPNVTWGEGGGSKNCLKSVTYYLNGP